MEGDFCHVRLCLYDIIWSCGQNDMKRCFVEVTSYKRTNLSPIP